MKKIEHVVKKVEKDSIAWEMEIEPGDVLLKINDEEIEDIFDYQYLIQDEYIEVLIKKQDGEEWLLEIDKDEQERRFNERMEDPEKQWKITDEDWRNREKWDAYVKAVDEMILRTSTTYAPWTIVEADSKYYARIKILETVVRALKNRI